MFLASSNSEFAYETLNLLHTSYNFLNVELPHHNTSSCEELKHRNKACKHPHPEWDSHPQFQCSSTLKTADSVVTDQQNNNILCKDNVNFNSG